MNNLAKSSYVYLGRRLTSATRRLAYVALPVSSYTRKGKCMENNSQMVTGLFKDRDSAERAYQSVSGKGYEQQWKRDGEHVYQ